MGALANYGGGGGGGGGGLLGGLVNTGKQIGGVALNALAAPEQVLLGAAGAAASLNDPRTAVSDLGHALVKGVTLGQGGGQNWDFAQAAGKQTAQGRMGVKLPTGVNTALSMGLDPLNFVGAGAGTEAKEGMGAIARGLGGIDRGIVEDSARKVGGRSLVENVGRDNIKSMIREDVLANSGKAAKIAERDGAEAAIAHADKQAEKLVSAIEKRGGGGIHLHAPGTDASATILKGSTIDAAKDAIAGSKVGQLVGEGARAAKLPEAVQAVRRGIEPGYKMAQDVGKVLSKDVRTLGSGRISRQEGAIDNLMAELSNGVKASEQRAGRQLTAEDDKLAQFALQGGPEARAEVLATHPHLEPFIDAGARIRGAGTKAQVDMGLLRESALHRDDTYLRRVMTPEMLKVLKANPQMIDQVASRVGGSTSGALYQRAAKARTLAPEMPDSLFNEVVNRVQQGEDARAILDEPRFDQYIGQQQKAEAAASLNSQLDYLHNKPTVAVGPEELKAQAAQHEADADQIIQNAIDSGEEHITIGSNVYKTPTTPVEKDALKQYLSTLSVAQKVDVNASGWSTGLGNAIDNAAHLLPSDINDARNIFLGNQSPEVRLPMLNKWMDWVTGGTPEAEAYTKAVQQGLKDAGFNDEIIVFRGYHANNSTAEFANVTPFYPTAQAFSSGKAIPRIYRVKLDNIIAAAHPGEAEYLLKAEHLEQIHPNELKDLRLPKNPEHMFTYEPATVADLNYGDKYRFNEHGNVMTYKGEVPGKPGFHNVSVPGEDFKTVQMQYKPGQAIQRATGMDTTALAGPKSAGSSALAKASAQADALELKKLAGGKYMLAEQLLSDGAITHAQLQKQIDAAMHLADVSSDTKPLKDLIAKQASTIAGQLEPGAKVYQESALASLIVRGNESARALQAAHYINEMRGLKTANGVDHILLSAEDLAAKKMAAPKGWASFELPTLGPNGGPGKFFAPQSVAEEVQRVTGYITQNESVKGFDNFMKNWMQFWKGHATTGLVGALPFGARNFRSNLFLMAAGGMGADDIAKYLPDAAKFQMKLRNIITSGKFAEDIARDGLEPVMKQQLKSSEFKLWKEAQDRGIITEGFFDFDFDHNIMDKVKSLGIDGGKGEGPGIVRRGAKAVLSHKGAVATKGRELNSAIEHNARLAAFMHAVDRSGNFEQAADHVKSVLFDYSDLTPLEQKRLKNIIPFYTFMRKNIPLQFRTLVENPQRIVLPEHVSQMFTTGVDDTAPDYEKQGGYRQIKKGLPFAGLVTAPDRPIYDVGDKLAPFVDLLKGQGKAAARDLANIPGGPQVGLLKSLAEIGTGKDTFTGGNVKPGAASDFQRLVSNQVPSLGRLPRVELPGKMSPSRALTGKAPKSAVSEATRLLTGIRTERPKK